MAKIDIIANQIALYLRKDGYQPVACACSGLSGVCVTCSLWWKLFLENYSADQIADMVRLYNFAKDIAAQQMREPDSLKAGDPSLPDVVKSESDLPS